ncbi:MAG: TonB-dependent receptor [Asticcacaulis sp.]
MTQASTWNVAQFYDNANRNTGNATTATLDGKYDADWGAISEISFGVRYDDRKAEESSRTQSDDAGLGINLGTLDAGYQYVNHDFFDGFGDVPRSWMDANGYYIRDHIDDFRTLVQAHDPDFRTTDQIFLHKSFDVDEKTASAYIMVDTDSQLGGHRLRTNWGLRYVNVDTDMTVYDWDNVAYKYTGQSSAKKSVGKFLPSATIRFEPSDSVVLRLNYGETLRRPNFTDLNPELNLTGDLTSVGYGQGSGGNPDLNATEAKNLDLTAEWYFSKDSAIYATAFDRKIDGLVVPFLHQVIKSGTGLNTDTFEVNTPYNASDGKLDGLELGVIYFPKNLPGILDGLGFQGSLTKLHSSQNVPLQDAAGNVTGTGQVNSPFFGVSNFSYNASVAYEKGPVGARLSYVYREKFLDRYEAPQSPTRSASGASRKRASTSS